MPEFETMKSVSVFMDVEDPINPLADVAALHIAQLFTSLGVRGSFCLTGEKCRKLGVRNRTDVVENLRPHCLGLHTDTHSEHPTTMELMEKVSFDEGCALAYEAEKRGFDAFVELFGEPPSFWGGAGNTWSPEITEALKPLGIPAYSYALTSLPNEAVHRFNGVFALPQALAISETSWMDEKLASSESERVLESVAATNRPWTGIFVGHPTKFRYAEFWDKVYAGGQTPVRLDHAKLVAPVDFQKGKDNLAAFLERLRTGFDILGVDDVLKRGWTFRPPTEKESDFFRAKTKANLESAVGWPIHRNGLDPSNIVSKTLALESTLEVAIGPNEVG